MGEVSAFGARLKMLRTQAGLSKLELATKAGVARPSIVKVEHGHHQDLSLRRR